MVDFVVVVWVLRRSLTSQVISIAFYIEREKSAKFCSEALISAWRSFTCRKSTTRNLNDGESRMNRFYAYNEITMMVNRRKISGLMSNLNFLVTSWQKWRDCRQFSWIKEAVIKVVKRLHQGRILRYTAYTGGIPNFGGPKNWWIVFLRKRKY